MLIVEKPWCLNLEKKNSEEKDFSIFPYLTESIAGYLWGVQHAFEEEKRRKKLEKN